MSFDTVAARAYFVAGIGASRADEMVIWSSSELPDTGFGLTVDYTHVDMFDRAWRLKPRLNLSAGYSQRSDRSSGGSLPPQLQGLVQSEA